VDLGVLDETGDAQQVTCLLSRFVRITFWDYHFALTKRFTLCRDQLKHSNGGSMTFGQP
jgi:hypothetical protein